MDILAGCAPLRDGRMAVRVELESGPREAPPHAACDGRAGAGYTVYASPDLQNWQILRQEPPLDSDRRVELNITPNPGARFFRVSIP